MANTNKVIDMITQEALKVAHETPSFLKTINRQYDDQFRAGNVGKGGSTLRIREPIKFTATTGRPINISEATETSQTLTVATQKHIAVAFNSAELTTDIEDLSSRYIAPMTQQLIAEIEQDVLTSCTKSVYQLVGTAGTVVGTSGDITALGLARAKINQQAAPFDRDSRYAVLDSVTMATIANAGIGSKFHDASNIKNAFTEGAIIRSAMADFFENEKTWTITNGTDHTSITVNDTVASGDAVVTLAGADMAVGTVFTMAGTFDVHPETKQAYSHLKQFAVTAVNGNDYSFTPTIISTGARQNVSALPSNGAAVVAHGSASTSYRQNLMYHRDAFTMVMADLPLKAGADKCSRGVRDGFALRVWVDSDIKNDEEYLRIDALYGYLAVRPEWACRISN